MPPPCHIGSQGPNKTVTFSFLMRGERCGTERKPGPTNGPRRSLNGATASVLWRGTPRRDGASPSARRPTRTPPARAAVPVPGRARPSSASLRMVRGGWSKRPPPPATCRPAKAGPSMTTGRWPRSLPKRRLKQPDVRNPPIYAIGGFLAFPLLNETSNAWPAAARSTQLRAKRIRSSSRKIYSFDRLVSGRGTTAAKVANTRSFLPRSRSLAA